MEIITVTARKRYASHLPDQLPVAAVPQLTWPKVPLHITREPVGITNYHLSEFLAVALSPC